MGSDILMDDAISIMLAKDLQQLFRDFELKILLLGGIGIIETISGYDVVVIIDTIIQADADPGDIILFDDIESARTLHLQNPHDVDFYTSVRLAEETGYRMPEKILVVGVQIRQQLVASVVCPPWMREKKAQMIEKIASNIDSLGVST